MDDVPGCQREDAENLALPARDCQRAGRNDNLASGPVYSPALDLRGPGQCFQAESDLHQNWMRDNDPTTGRFMLADPLGLADGASVYRRYVENWPEYFADGTFSHNSFVNRQVGMQRWIRE